MYPSRLHRNNLRLNECTSSSSYKSFFKLECIDDRNGKIRYKARNRVQLLYYYVVLMSNLILKPLECY